VSTGVEVLGVSVEPTRPSEVGPEAWRDLVGPWEIDYSYANMRALEEHPFNDSTGPRTFWWLVRRGHENLGLYAGYVTETYNFATLFTVGWLRVFCDYSDWLYRLLNRHGLFRPLDRVGIGSLLRIFTGRTRVMFLGAHTADVGGQVLGPRFQQYQPDAYMPAIASMIDRESRALRVEQITFREVSERAAGPFHYENLWLARWPDGRPVLETVGFLRDPGLPAAYLDMREIAIRHPNEGDLVYAFYRHNTAAEFLDYEAARRAWQTETGQLLATDPTLQLPFDRIATHPRSRNRTEETRLIRFRNQLFRGGLLPPALVGLAELDRVEGALTNALRTTRRLERWRAVAEGLSVRIADLEARLPSDMSVETYRRAHELVRLRADVATAVELKARIGGTPSSSQLEGAADLETQFRTIARRIGLRPGEQPTALVEALKARERDLLPLADAHRREQAILARINPDFAALSSELRRKLIDLAAGRIRQRDLEERRVLESLGSSVDGPHASNIAVRARFDNYLGLAVQNADLDRELRAARTQITLLSRRTRVKTEEAEACWAAMRLLASHGDRLPEAVVAVLAGVETLRQRLAEIRAALDAGERHLADAATRLQPLLTGAADDMVRAELLREMRYKFRKEQDRIATDGFGGVPPTSAAERRSRLESVLSYRPVDYGRILLGQEGLRDTDRERVLREHREYRDSVRERWPDQPGPVAPTFDEDGYLVAGLVFTARDERVWTNLADQDRMTDLYHRVMAKSLIRHEVVDWPYYASYRAAAAQSGDELHFGTLRAGGENGPMVGAVTVKRSAAGHFRPERIALSGTDFGAYHSLVILVMANEMSLGGTYCSLGQTSQGTKLRDFGASFTDAHEYSRFQGIAAKVFRFDRVRRKTFKSIHMDRILEIAAMPPEQRDEAARRAGIRWHI
jgi:hypothetical protein